MGVPRARVGVARPAWLVCSEQHGAPFACGPGGRTGRRGRRLRRGAESSRGEGCTPGHPHRDGATRLPRNRPRRKIRDTGLPPGAPGPGVPGPHVRSGTCSMTCPVPTSPFPAGGPGRPGCTPCGRARTDGGGYKSPCRSPRAPCSPSRGRTTAVCRGSRSTRWRPPGTTGPTAGRSPCTTPAAGPPWATSCLWRAPPRRRGCWGSTIRRRARCANRRPRPSSPSCGRPAPRARTLP